MGDVIYYNTVLAQRCRQRRVSAVLAAVTWNGKFGRPYIWHPRADRCRATKYQIL